MNKTKRAVSDEPIYLTKEFFTQLYLQFISRHYPYKTLTQFKERDSAIACFLVLSGCRASEIGVIKKKQVVNLEDRILVLNVKTKKRGYMREEITFPKTGLLKEFTLNFEKWFNMIPESKEGVLFPHGSHYGINWDQGLTRKRIERIIKIKTGKFPHWLRGVHEMYYGEMIFQGNAWELADHMGLKRLDSTRPYVQSRYKKKIEERLFK